MGLPTNGGIAQLLNVFQKNQDTLSHLSKVKHNLGLNYTPLFLSPESRLCGPQAMPCCFWVSKHCLKAECAKWQSVSSIPLEDMFYLSHTSEQITGKCHIQRTCMYLASLGKGRPGVTALIFPHEGSCLELPPGWVLGMPLLSTI